MIQFVYFDLGGVLFRWRHALKSLSEIFGRSEENILRVFRSYDDSVCRGEVDAGDILRIFERELGVKGDIADFLDWWTGQFYPIKEAHELLHEVRAKYRVGLLTNTYKGALRKYLDKGQVPDLPYEVVVQSWELGLAKPQREIFVAAQERAGVQAHEILLIDDSKPNIEMAQALGWNVVLFDEAKVAQSVLEIRRVLGL